jgi:hypothetical protein
MMALEHGRTRYTRGCRGDVCKAAERDYRRNIYRRQRGLPVDPPDLRSWNWLSLRSSRASRPRSRDQPRPGPD